MSDYQIVFDAIRNDPRYQANLDWGEPRAGHPEGTVRAHIAELERNLETLRPKLTDSDYGRLQILIHTHDSFKAQAKTGVPFRAPNSHASLAAAFLRQHCQDADLLAMVQFHDEPYALWRQSKFKGRFSQERLAKLLQTIRSWDVFLAFSIVDGCTKGKSREPLRWFFKQVGARVQSKFTEADILETAATSDQR